MQFSFYVVKISFQIFFFSLRTLLRYKWNKLMIMSYFYTKHTLFIKKFDQALCPFFFLKQGTRVQLFCKIVWLLWRQIIPSNWEDRWKVVPSSHKHLIELCSTDAAPLSSVLFHNGLKSFWSIFILMQLHFFHWLVNGCNC